MRKLNAILNVPSIYLMMFDKPLSPNRPEEPLPPLELERRVALALRDIARREAK